jgi:hypothetical protein
MHSIQRLTIAAAAAVLVGAILPALAAPDGMDGRQSDGRSGMRQGMMSGHMMGDSMMSGGGMMAGRCANMMQSMNGAGGPPNSQWRKPSPGNGAPD